MKMKIIVAVLLSLFVLSCSSYSSRDIASDDFKIQDGDDKENHVNKKSKQNRYDFIDRR